MLQPSAPWVAIPADPSKSTSQAQVLVAILEEQPCLVVAPSAPVFLPHIARVFVERGGEKGRSTPLATPPGGAKTSW